MPHNQDPGALAEYYREQERKAEEERRYREAMEQRRNAERAEQERRNREAWRRR